MVFSSLYSATPKVAFRLLGPDSKFIFTGSWNFVSTSRHFSFSSQNVTLL
jgi:hypothetical protein